jgi:REase_DpnII-MboI
MAEFNFSNFLQNVEEDLKEARTIFSRIADQKMLERFPPYDGAHETGYFLSGEKDFDEILLEEEINKAILKIKFALEYLNLNNLLTEFNKKLSEYKTYHDQFNYIDYIDVLDNPIINHLQNYIDAITCQLDPKSKMASKREEGKILLERILIGTPKVISDNKLEPRNEAEIKNSIYKLLIHVFPDTVREIPISKISKVYKPDIGIRSLKIAIEYKFADSAEELKKSIGGIFEDIQGYEGSEDWKTFYAVIYQTDHYMTPFQIEEEFKLSNVNHNWKPILVFGKGKRLDKKTKILPQKT